MIEDLAKQIWERPEFQSEYHQLLKNNIDNSLHLDKWEKVKDSYIGVSLSEDAIRRLLQVATNFAISSLPEFREAAYRIAIATLNLFHKEYNLNEFAVVILSRLGNFPAIQFLKGIYGQVNEESIPSTLLEENLYHLLKNTFNISEEYNITFTDFQRTLWEKLICDNSAAITAPTSAGKSYVLQNYLIKSTKELHKWGLYIIPTRALINQVTTSLKNISKMFEYECVK